MPGFTRTPPELAPSAVDGDVSTANTATTEPAGGRSGVGGVVALHLLPGVALAAFLLVAVPALDRRGIDPLFALFGGICLVIVPVELGYLSWRARRTAGSWSPLAVVEHSAALPPRRLAATIARLAGWFIVVLVISIAVVDRWLADHVFAFLPDAIIQFAHVDDDASLSGVATVALLVVAIVGNGIAGPITEELYFRGHLLPRLRPLGRHAPVVHTILFAIYHLWTPWRWPAIVAGFLPITRRTWRSGDLRLSIGAHVTINLTFLALLAASYLATT